MSRTGLPIQVIDRKGEIPKNLTPQDFSVMEDGVSRPVAGIAPVSQPWQVVVYVDRILTGSRTLRAAAGVLAESAPELAALGTVEIVVAEPEPRVLLSPTRTAKAIDEVLSRLWLSGEGRDDLSSLRRRFLEERAAAGEQGLDTSEIAEAVDTETRLVRRQQEELAEWLTSRSGGGGPKLLLLVTDGFERNPAAFYGGPAEGEGTLERTALETARTAAALGWTILPLPVGEANLPDLRIRPGGPRNAPIGGTITLGGKKKKDEKKPEPPPPSVLVKAKEPLEWMAEASGGSLILRPQDIPSAL
ncbi:MAG TPA: hypothetical protein VIW92_02995, partial [Thermoanaerobaculia bacterium]